MNKLFNKELVRVLKGMDTELIFAFKLESGYKTVILETLDRRGTYYSTLFVDGQVHADVEAFITEVAKLLKVPVSDTLSVLALRTFGAINVSADVSFDVPNLAPMQGKDAEEWLKAEGISRAVEFDFIDRKVTVVSASVDSKPLDSTTIDWDAPLLEEAILNLEDAKKKVGKYKVTDRRIELALRSLTRGTSIALLQVGPAGGGKTTTAIIHAVRTNNPLFYMTGTPNGDEGTYLGSYSPSEEEGKQFEFRMKVIGAWAKHGGDLVIDEPNVILNGGILTAINNLIEYPYQITMENGEVVRLHETCRIFLNYNAGYEGTIPLNFSIKNRMAHVITYDDIDENEVNSRLDQNLSYRQVDVTHLLYKDIYKYCAEVIHTEPSSGMVSYRNIEGFIKEVIALQDEGDFNWSTDVACLVDSMFLGHCFSDEGFETIQGKLVLLEEPIKKLVKLLKAGGTAVASADDLFFGSKASKAVASAASADVDEDILDKDAESIIDDILSEDE